MSFNERISVVIDVATDKASQALGGFRKSVNEAEGFTGKLKAGVGSLGQTFTSFISSPAGAATAITAVTAAAAKAVTAAADLGIQVGQLADSTGLSTEAASRWLEVGADMGVGADKIAGLIEKMTLNLGKSPAKFKELGIEVQTAADGTADMNATLLLAIDRLDKITDPTQKAKVAADLFGRSWADAAELVGLGADKVKEKLADVSDAKLFDSKKVAEAREFRDQMENLKDVGEDLAMTIGKELLPAITDLVGGITAIKGPLDDLDGMYKKATGGSSLYAGSLTMLKETLDVGLHGIDSFTEGARKSATETEAAMRGISDSMEPTKKSTEQLTAEAARASGQWRITADSADEMAAATERVRVKTEALALLLGTLDDDEALLNLQQQFDDLKTQAEADYAAVAAGSMTAEQATRNHELALIDLKKMVADYATEVLKLPAEQVSKIIAEMTDANADEIEMRLTVLARTRNATIVANLVTTGTHAGVGDQARSASGTNNARPGFTLVGEQGPELVRMGGGERVSTADETKSLLDPVAFANVVGPMIARAIRQELRSA